MNEKIRDLRNRVMSMQDTDYRQELAETLDILDQIAFDFKVVIREVANGCYDRNREVYDTSRDLDRVAERHGVEY